MAKGKAIAVVALLAAASSALGWFGARHFAREAPMGPPPAALAGRALFGLLLLAFVAAAGAAMLERADRQRAARFWRAAGLLAVTLVALAAGAAAGEWSVRDRHAISLERAGAILDAIDSCARVEGRIPDRLEELVPRHLTSIPMTGYRGRFRFERGPGLYRLFFFDDLGLRHVFDSRVRRWKAE